MFFFLEIKEFHNFFFLLLTIIFLLLCLYFYLSNKKLKNKILKLELEVKEILERKIIKNTELDLVSIKSLSEDMEKNIKKEKEKNVNKKDDLVEINIIENKSEKNSKYVAKSNEIDEPTLKVLNPILSNMNKMPVNLEDDILEVNLDKKIVNINDIDFNLDEFINKKENIMKKKESLNNKYLEEISSHIESEMKPSTIELTEYEKEQEEHAIISYQELLSAQNKELSDEEMFSNAIFIEELKKLRNLLDKSR